MLRARRRALRRRPLREARRTVRARPWPRAAPRAPSPAPGSPPSGVRRRARRLGRRAADSDVAGSAQPDAGERPSRERRPQACAAVDGGASAERDDDLARAGVDGGEQELAEAERGRAHRVALPGSEQRQRPIASADSTTATSPGQSRNRASTGRPSGSATCATPPLAAERGCQRLRRPLAAIGQRQLLGIDAGGTRASAARERGRRSPRGQHALEAVRAADEPHSRWPRGSRACAAAQPCTTGLVEPRSDLAPRARLELVVVSVGSA